MASGDATQKRSHAKTAKRWAGHVRRKHQPASAQAAESGRARPSGAKLRQLDVRAITRPAHDCPEGAPAGRLRGKCPGARNASVARASGAPARALRGGARAALATRMPEGTSNQQSAVQSARQLHFKLRTFSARSGEPESGSRGARAQRRNSSSRASPRRGRQQRWRHRGLAV